MPSFEDSDPILLGQQLERWNREFGVLSSGACERARQLGKLAGWVWTSSYDLSLRLPPPGA